MELSGPRWKGKGFADIAAKNPMSELVVQLKSSLIQLKATAMLSDCVSLLEVKKEISDLLSRSCFGRQISTTQSDSHWFQLSSEETFYIHHSLQALLVVNDAERLLSELELWNHFRSKKRAFPELYMSYAHLRSKNWVVRAGAQYGVDFVAYRHHPALVHSEYAILVILAGCGNNVQQNSRLRTWPDFHCSLRVSGSVAKTLLVLFIDKNGSNTGLPSCLQQFSVEERTITRWIAEQSREDDCLDKDCSNELNS